MSLTPPFIPRLASDEFPQPGTVSLRVMNDVQLLTEQEAAVLHQFELHKQRLRASLVGYLTHSGELTDGTTFRFQSNGPQHTVMVWPAGGGEEQQRLREWFRAVPTSDSIPLGGDGKLPSQGWKVPQAPDHWPEELKPLSERPEHPGHVSWSNANLKFGGTPIVVSWRGPRGRYAATTGFTDARGGGAAPHEPVTALSTTLFNDTAFVWIDGYKIDTGRQKVIAACLHEYDPEGAKNKFVLRVCCDLRSGFPRRQFVVYDLVPTDGSDGASLQQLAEARGPLFVKATYTADANTPDADLGGSSSTPGEWDYWQRPHFNQSGTRLATIISMVGGNGVDREMHAVSFDPTTWAIDDDAVAHFASAAPTGGGGGGGGETFEFTFGGTSTLEAFIAADFEGDAFVYVMLTSLRDYVGSGGTAAEGQQEPGKPNSGVSHRSDSFTCTVTHSVLGELHTSTSTGVRDFSMHYTGNGDAVPYLVNASITYTLTGGYADFAGGFGGGFTTPHFAFLGDLSRGTFALGYWADGSASFSGTGAVSGGDSFTIPMAGTRQRPQLVFDVWFDNAQVATATKGAFADAAPAAEVAGYGELTGSLSEYIEGGMPTVATTTNTGSGTALYGSPQFPQYPPQREGPASVPVGEIRGANYGAGVPHAWQQCAVNASRSAAYFGAEYFKEAWNDHVTSGLELTIVQPGGASPIVHDAIAYIAGAHPTMAAPVFMGPALEGAPK